MITIPNLGDLYKDEGRTFFCYAAQEQFGQRLTRSIRMDSEPMKHTEQIKQDYNRLHAIANGHCDRSIAYPILARHGMMERTENGYKAIDPETVDRRCCELIDRIMDEYLQSLSE